MDKPKDGDIHQCELLKYQDWYIECCVSHGEKMRWRLIRSEGQIGPNDMVHMQHVLFCPACGEDFRQHTSNGWGGKPALNKILSDSGVQEAD
jgi:hypothetical protein